MFVARIVKIGTLNKDVLDSEWTLTSCALRLVCTRELFIRLWQPT